MKSLNKVFLIGNLAADPELRSTNNGNNLATFRVATNRSIKGTDGERQDTADFHNIVTWKRLADLCAEYLKKGSPVHIIGHIVNRSYKTQTGEDRKVTEIVADEVNFLNSRKVRDADEIELIEEPVEE